MLCSIYPIILFLNISKVFKVTLYSKLITFDATVMMSDVNQQQKARYQMFSALKAHKEILEEKLKKKAEELKQLCLDEAVSDPSLDRLYVTKKTWD